MDDTHYLHLPSYQETGRVPMQEPTTEFSLEAPGGEVQVRALCDRGRVQKVSLIPQPAYMALAGVTVNILPNGLQSTSRLYFDTPSLRMQTF